MDDDAFISLLEMPDISGYGDLFVTMFGAVQLGDIDGLKAIRSAEPEPFKERLRVNGGLLLFEAVRMGLYDVGEFLLANGCSLRMCQGMKSSALHLAAYNPDAADFLDRLATYSPNCVNDEDINYNSPLHVACFCNNVKGVQTLLARGASVDKTNNKKQCPLDLSLSGGHVECVRLLLEHYDYLQDTVHDKIDLNDFKSVKSYVDKCRAKTQMQSAAKCLFDVLGHKNVVKVLKSLHHWDQPRSNEILSELKALNVDLADDVLNAVKCRLQCVDLLVQKHFEFNMLHLSLKYLSQDCYFTAVKYLVEDYGMDVNSMDTLHFTPLHIAVDRSDFEVVKYLLDRGAMVNGTWNMVGITLLEAALEKAVINEAIVRLLVERGAQVNFIRSNGWCPLKRVLEIHDEKLARFLVDSGADVDLKNPATGLSIFSDFLFMTISRQYNLTAMKFLLEHGASLDYDRDGATPLHFIASVLTSRDSNIVEFASLLIEYSADINSLDVEGNTPLMKAIKVPFHSIPMIRLLLESGADPQLGNLVGESPLQLAITLRKVDVITLLMEYGVVYDPNVLFSNNTVLLDSIIINIPYSRKELFTSYAFVVRQDVPCERKLFVDGFLKATRDPDLDYFDDLSVCLYELLRRSPLERSCMASMTSGSTVLFSQVEQHVLKMKLRGQVNESLLRGVLEYRIRVNEVDSFISACDREIITISKEFIPCVGFEFLFLPERDQMLILSTQKDIQTALRVSCSYTLGGIPVFRAFPIFGITLMTIIIDILSKFDLLSSATLFFNRHVSRVRETAPHFKSLPQHIIDNILSYLSPSDLINLIFLEKNVFPRSVELFEKRWKMKLDEFLKKTTDSRMKIWKSLKNGNHNLFPISTVECD